MYQVQSNSKQRSEAKQNNDTLFYTQVQLTYHSHRVKSEEMTLNEKVMASYDVSSTSSTSSTKVTANKQTYGKTLVGKTVLTTYGQGVVLECRDEDGFVYVIQLTSQGGSERPLATLYTRELPTRIKTPLDEASEFNLAFETHEKMRRMNLEMQCFELGITEINHDACATCLLSGESSKDRTRFPRLQKFVDTARETATSATMVAKESSSIGMFPNLRKLLAMIDAEEEKQQETDQVNINEQTTTISEKKPKAVLPRIQKVMDNRQQSSVNQCLICGNPVCSEHSSKIFRKEGITLCFCCERLFELDFIVECVSTPDVVERARHIDHMVDCYDRCLLLLKYSTQFVEPIARSLEQQKQKQNKIGLGSSGVGVLSGVLGIAAAATILTPVGPSLLMASLFFGGSATAIQTGTEAYNYFSEPNKLADRIIALHGMILSILRVTSTLRDAMMRDHIRTDVFEAEKLSLTDTFQETLEKNKGKVLVASNAGRAATLGSVAGTEAGVVASASGVRGATALSRASTAAARTVRFARFAGGALSAAVLVMEANAIHGTLQDIRDGSPCDKAEHIKAIAEEIDQDDLPSTSELDEECQAYLAALANRPIPPPEVQAVEVTGRVNEDFTEAECVLATTPISNARVDQSTEELLLSGGEVLVATVASTAVASPLPHQQSSILGSMTTSLFQRIDFRRRGESDNRLEEAFVEASVENRRNLRDSEINLVL